jgi:Zn-dependent peptidase ImmA (M78 family)/DNA-binding XRE family transcriptional regulator
MAIVKAHITPEVIKWARESCGYSLEEAAKKIGRSAQEIAAWETGQLQPTISQARKASEIYKRPFAVFYLPEPPEGFSTLRDFRRLPSDYPRKYSPHLNFLIRQTIDRQCWLRDYLISEEIEPLDFTGSANLSDNIVKLAEKIRSKLGVAFDDIQRCSRTGEALRLWISKVEELGVCVSRGGSYPYEQIEVLEARGFALTDDYAPFIFLNAQDAKAGQIFTLIHELVHLWINAPGLSNLIYAGKVINDSDRVEIFCNAVSAEVLVPQKYFRQQWQRTIPGCSIENAIDANATHFKVSREVIARRLLDWGKITNKKYTELSQSYAEEWQTNKQREKQRHREQKGGPGYYIIKSMNNGYSFCKTVIAAYQGGKLSGRDTSHLLGVKLNKLFKVADAIHIPFATIGGGV